MEKKGIKTVIIREKDKEKKYKAEDLQGAEIKAVEFLVGDDLESELVRLLGSKKKNEFPVYILGSEDFRNAVVKAACIAVPCWKLRMDCQTEDMVMKKEGLDFPEKHDEARKSRPVDKKAVTALDSMQGMNISRSDVAGVFMAAEELSSMRIFPPTEEYKYNAFVRITERYIPDKTKAKAAVDCYLAYLADKMSPSGKNGPNS